MKHRPTLPALVLLPGLFCAGLLEAAAPSAPPIPKQVIDLGAVVTEDLSVRISGKAMGRPGKFEFNQRKNEDGTVAGQSSMLTMYSHAGPHVDAPIHAGVPGGLDTVAAERFAGPVKVVDARKYGTGYTIPVDEFRRLNLTPQDIVLIYTGYRAPTTDDGRPETKTLSREAAEYLASIPLRAFGTDAWGVESIQAQAAAGASPANAFSVHRILLSRMPVFEQLQNLDRLLGMQSMFLVGAPLNIKDGDAFPVRPLVLVY